MKKKLLLFFLGSICFIVSQPLLRFPILNYLQSTTKFILFYRLNPLLVGILIAFSAGIFEEGFRFLFRRFLIKPVNFGLLYPIIFGLGHGLAEAVIVLSPVIFRVTFSSLYVAILERLLTIILHVGLTVMIWNGFQLNKKYKYLGIAIVVHGLVNSLIPIFSLTKYWIILVESSLAIIDILIIIYIVKSRQYYSLEEEKV